MTVLGLRAISRRFTSYRVANTRTCVKYIIAFRYGTWETVRTHFRRPPR